MQHKKGFSLIEVTLATFLVSLGLVTTISLLSRAFADSADARNQSVAALLAQEGIEYVRNIRENNWVDGKPATSSYTGFSGSALDCIIDKNYLLNILRTNGSLNCGIAWTADDARIYKDSGDYYVQGRASGGIAPTKFFRRIAYREDPLNSEPSNKNKAYRD